MSHLQLAPLATWTQEYILSLPPAEFDWLDFKESGWLSLDSECLDKLLVTSPLGLIAREDA